MPCLSAKTKRTSFALFALIAALSAGAQEKEKPASLIGISKEEVYARLGEPRSQMKAGAREVIFFSKIKVTIRNNVVVETEPLFDDVQPKRPVESAPAGASVAAPGEGADAAKSAKSGAVQPAAAVGASADPAPAPAAKSNPALTEIKPVAVVEPQGSLEIKFVRAPGKAPPRPAARPPAPAAVPLIPAVLAPVSVPVTAAPAANFPAPIRPPVQPSVASPVSAAPSLPLTTVAASSASSANTEKAATSPEVASTPPVEPADGAVELDGAQKPKAKLPPQRFFRTRVEAESELPEVPLFSAQTYVLGVGVVGAVVYLFWRRRQRQLDLAASSVSSTPFEEPSAVDSAALFTSDFLGKLEWKHFEELVAAYYVKTGVVAVRTKTGPDSPVHLNISWKGEAKPFACVQCHASPVGLIRMGPLQALHTALTVAEIRRGYVVTNGKFNVEARDFAEEKHFTLLSGDLFLEKLNALPPAARIDLMQTTSASDFSTPTCPKCDVRMVRAEGAGWRCPNRPKCEATIPAAPA